MLRKNSDDLSKMAHDIIEPGAVLVFPKNHDFISKLPKSHIKSLIRHGWKTEKTIFLEIPYVITFTQNFDPSLVQVWLTCVPSKRSIFRAVVFTKGYIPNASRIELEDTILHEQIHILEDEPKMQNGLSVSVNYDENEERVEQMVKEILLKKYGSVVHQADIDSTVMAFETQRKLKTMSSGFLEYWIQIYFEDKFDEYSDFAIKMNNTLSSEGYLNDIRSTYNKVSKMYKENFNFDLREPCLKS